MSVATKKAVREQFFNVPNQLTVLRLILSVVLFVFIGFGYYLTSMILFMVAALTDWLDGYWARKYAQITSVGRILDPFVDKITVCGTFIFLLPIDGSGVQAWMVAIIVGRELLVTGLRSFLEREGSDFSAKMSGKLKMTMQCIAAVLCLYSLWYDHSRPEWLHWAVSVSLWLAVALTVYSGVAYVQRAVRLVRG